MAELSDGTLLLLAGDVQATPAARQLIRRQGDRFLNGPLLPVGSGGPPDPEKDPQGGFLPESIVCLEGDLLVGARRNKPYSCSADLGNNWSPLPGIPASLYQPSLQLLPDGSLACFGHFGGDVALGQADMYIAADFFRVEGRPPAAAELSLERLMTPEQDQYRNAYAAVLTQGGIRLSGQRVVFRFTPYWDPDGTACTRAQNEAPIRVETVTDAQGRAEASVPAFDRIADIHFYYNVDAWFPGDGKSLLPCTSPMRCEAAMTPRRHCLRPYAAYLAGGVLYVSRELEEAFPDIYALLTPQCGQDPAEGPASLPQALASALLAAGVLIQTGDALTWAPSTHAPVLLADVKPMGRGDWYE